LRAKRDKLTPAACNRGGHAPAPAQQMPPLVRSASCLQSTLKKHWSASVFAVDHMQLPAYVPRHSSPTQSDVHNGLRESVAQLVEQLTFNQ
jgi:hypothetical protein